MTTPHRPIGHAVTDRDRSGPLTARIERTTTDGTPTRGRFDLLQVATVIASVYLMVIGLVAIARAGFFDAGLTDPVVEVGTIHTTPIFALVLLFVGVLLLWAGVGEEIDDLGIRVVSGILLVLGIVLIIEPSAFQPALGSEPGDGWHHVLLGGVLLILSFLPPISLQPPASPRRPAEGPSDAGPSDAGPPNDGTTQRIR